MPLSEVSAAELLEALPDPALAVRPDGVVSFANAAARRFLDVDVDQAPNITAFIPEHERQRLKPLEWLQRWANTPEAPEREFVHLTCRTADGQETAVRALVGRVGEPTSYIVVLHDVGAELARQRSARDAHRIAARVLAISADAVVNANADQRIEYVNASAEQLFGYQPGELVGQPLDRLIPARFRERHEDDLAGFRTGPEPSRFMGQRGVIFGVTKAGEEVPLEASISKVTQDRGVIFSALLRDVRPRRAAERDLAQSRARFATVFDNALQAMALLEPDGTVIEVNAAARALLRDDRDVIGGSLALLPWWTTGSVEAELKAGLEQCRSGAVYRTQAEIQRDGQAPIALDVSLKPVVDDHGSTFAIIAEARELR